MANNTAKRILILAIAVTFASGFASGCASKFSCMETIDGVRCKNLQGVYDEKVTATGVYNSQVAVNPTPKKEKIIASENYLTEKEAIIRHLEVNDPRPIRLPPIVLRIWTSPWEDEDGDLHNAGYIYTEVEQRRGRWLFGEGAVARGGSAPTQSKVYSTQQGKAEQASIKQQKDGKKTEENKTDKYYGQKPPTELPRLRLSK